MNHLRPWHYLVEGALTTACGALLNEVFGYSGQASIVTCTECMKNSDYLAQRMELALEVANPWVLICSTHFIEQPEQKSVGIFTPEPCAICGKLLRQGPGTVTMRLKEMSDYLNVKAPTT